MPILRTADEAALKRNRPLINGLDAFILGASSGPALGYNVLSRSHMGPSAAGTGLATLDAGPGGAGLKFNGSSSRLIQTSGVDAASVWGGGVSAAARSIMVVFSIDALPASGVGTIVGQFRYASGSFTGSRFSIQVTTAGVLQLNFGGTQRTGPTLETGRVYRVVVSYPDGTNPISLWVNGELTSLTASTTSGNAFETAMLGAAYLSGAFGNFFNGKFYAAGFWRRALSVQECQALCADPYRPIERVRDRIWLRPVAAAGNDVTPGVGALPVTGFAPGLAASLTPGAGVAAFNGFSPSLQFTVTPPVGALIWTGYAPTLDTGAPGVTPGLGVLSFAGFAPSVQVSAGFVEPLTGTIAITGFAPVLDGASAALWTAWPPASGIWTKRPPAGGTWT